MINKDKKFIQEHIENPMSFDDYQKEATINEQAKKAFYAVWSNYIFINPTTQNLRELKESDYAIIKKLTYGAKNRLQSYIAFHLNRDHYEMNFMDLNEDQAYTVIRMCEEVFEDTKLLVDWWRNPVSVNDSQTGEEWFKVCKEKFQHQKQINKLGFSFIDLVKKRFLLLKNGEVFWTTNQDEATRFNLMSENKILDQDKFHNEIDEKVSSLIGLKGLKSFHQGRGEGETDFFFEV